MSSGRLGFFGTGPAKRRPGYANFAVRKPPLKLVLLENPGQGGTLNHLGIEVPGIESVDAEQTRLARAGLVATDKRATTCCYATQDKFWVQGAPGGEPWEIYTVLEDSPACSGDDTAAAACRAGTEPAGAGSAVCCGGAQETGDPATVSAARRC